MRVRLGGLAHDNAPLHVVPFFCGEIATRRYTRPMRSIMLRRCRLLVILAGLLTLTACQRAQQYQLPAKRPTLKIEENDD
jgi:hypothetical protein